MNAMLLIAMSLGPVESVWTVERPLGDLASCIKEHVSSPAAHLPPALLTERGAEQLGRNLTRVQWDWRPAEHYIWSRVDVRVGRISGYTTLEAWGQGPHTTMRLATTMSLPRHGPVATFIARIAERLVVSWERSQLRSLASPD